IIFNLVAELSKPIVRIEDAPSSIEVNVRTKGNSVFLYLINFTSDMRRPIQEIIPCRNIKISLFMMQKVKSIKALWLERNLDFAQKGNSISFALPVIKDYEVIEVKI